MLFNIRHRQLFKRVIEPHRNDVYRFLLWLCYDPAVAEDALQETLLRAWRSLDSIRNMEATKPWLLTIARRELARMQRSHRRQGISLNNLEETGGVEMLLEEEDSVERSVQDIEDIRRAVRQLDVIYREPLILQIWFGYTTGEIAEHMQLSQSAVLTRLFRAREKLRVMLDGSAESARPADVSTVLSRETTALGTIHS